MKTRKKRTTLSLNEKYAIWLLLQPKIKNNYKIKFAYLQENYGFLTTNTKRQAKTNKQTKI